MADGSEYETPQDGDFTIVDMPASPGGGEDATSSKAPSVAASASSDKRKSRKSEKKRIKRKGSKDSLEGVKDS